MSSNAKGSSLKSREQKLPLDREVLALLHNDAELLAIADAVAATQAEVAERARAPMSWWRRFPRLRLRTPLARS